MVVVVGAGGGGGVLDVLEFFFSFSFSWHKYFLCTSPPHSNMFRNAPSLMTIISFKVMLLGTIRNDDF